MASFALPLMPDTKYDRQPVQPEPDLRHPMLVSIDRFRTGHTLQHRRQPAGKAVHRAYGPFCIRRKPHE